MVNGTQINKWVVGTAVNNGGTQSLYITNDNGVSNAYTINTASVVQAYRDLAIPAGTSEVNLSFDWRAAGESSFDYIRVWLVPTTFNPTPGTQITAANSGGIQLGANYNQNPNWTTANYIINTAAFAGQNRRLVFEWRNDTSAGTQPPAAIDNVNLSVISCSAPTALTVSNLTDVQATLSWTGPLTAPSGGYDYYYSTTNTAPTATTTPNGNVSATTVDITGLTANTTYYFWVRSNCGDTDGNSFWSGPRAFTTTQIPATLPYTEGFEGTIDWTLVNGTQTNKWVVGTAVSNGGTHSLYISNNNGAAHAYTTSGAASTVQAYRDILFPAGANEVNLSFDWRAAGESSFDYLRVWLVPATFSPTAGTLITAANSGGTQLGANYNLTPNWTTATYAIDASAFDGQVRRLIFEWRNDGSGGAQPPAAIDNIALSVATCPRPINVEITCSSSTMSNVNWEAGGTETSWEVVVLPATAPMPTSGTVVTDPLYYAEGLTPDTNYTAYVRAICGPDDVSIWREVDFSTGTSSVLESTPFCASQNEGQYILFDNVHDGMNAPEYGDVACLGSTPNPVWYYLQVDSPGNLNFQLIQNTAFNASGNPIGTGLDVDFVAFGPFTSLNEACGQIELEDCPTCPFSNVGSTFYPFGNIIDCSYSAAPIENFSIPNAQEGQIYAVLITNFNGDPGQIKLQQLATSTGSTNCNILYNVDLGENQSYCGAASATITATVTTPGNSEEPNYEWFMDGEEYTPTIVSTTPLTQTISVTEPGIHTYSVVITVANATNTEPITDEVTVALIPAVVVPDPAAVVLCGNGGSASIDLSTLTGGVLGALNPADYVVEYYLTEAAANAGTSPIDITAPFVTTTQTIYVRIESVLLGTCFDVVPLPITVNTSADATIEYADSP
ncbi:fibronectin type III domain-containing protein, partial [Nostoc linckia]|uniref:fibronectin type III domain-containing protein n=1 Tax=Nostoc linckia TaxID=92942 RepID=UPI00117F95B0